MAAEIANDLVHDASDLDASMRPRRMAAEISRFSDIMKDYAIASMRPRRMAAEIGTIGSGW